MTFLLIGASHRTAPVDVRERLVVPEEHIPVRLRRLLERGTIGEAMILSTCNRTEVVVHAEGDAAAAIQGVKDVLGEGGDLDDAALERILYVKRDRDAIRHLFRLGVGLDSMILGEPQILGQVKAAYARAEASGTLGSHLRPLFQRVFSVAKKVRTDTDIGRNPVSVSYAAVGLAHQIFGALNDRSILLLGAGETAELSARHLAAQGIRKIFVANRTFMRAEELAAKFDGEAVPFDRFLEYLVDVDVLISST
ncbi:MAG: glutamyl-tRNA reductase, partial [Acidobacteriota bacterium]